LPDKQKKPDDLSVRVRLYRPVRGGLEVAQEETGEVIVGFENAPDTFPYLFNLKRKGKYLTAGTYLLRVDCFEQGDKKQKTLLSASVFLSIVDINAFPPPFPAWYNLGMSGAISAALVVAFIAFCIWLTVRIVNRRERWAIQTAVAFAMVPVLYPLSLGPACWLSSKLGNPQWLTTPGECIYAPLAWMLGQPPNWLSDLLSGYVAWWAHIPG
jgi:hypothetical protein